MEFLGIGPLELFFILVIVLIILGPKDMIKAGKTIGSLLRKLVTSPTYRMIQQTSQDLKNLPTKLIRDSGLEDDLNEISRSLPTAETIRREMNLDSLQNDLNETSKQVNEDLSSWTQPPDLLASSETPPTEPESNDSEPRIEPETQSRSQS